MIILLNSEILLSYIINRYIKFLNLISRLLSNKLIRIYSKIRALIFVRSLDLIRILIIYVLIKLLLIVNNVIQSSYNLINRSINLESI